MLVKFKISQTVVQNNTVLQHKRNSPVTNWSDASLKLRSEGNDPARRFGDRPLAIEGQLQPRIKAWAGAKTLQETVNTGLNMLFYGGLWSFLRGVGQSWL